MISGWFSALRADGTIASGDRGIYVTPPSLPGQPEPPATKVSDVGLRAVWAGQTLVFNRNDGSTAVGPSIMPAAYNEYLGSDFGQWVGFASVGAGWLARYAIATENTAAKEVHAVLLQSIDGACKPQFFGQTLGYLKPFQAVGPLYIRQLWIGGAMRADGAITEWAADRTGAFYVLAIASGYQKTLYDNMMPKPNDITIRAQKDETPLVAFLGPDGLPWIVSQTTNSGTFVRMIYSSMGYVIPGILDNPDARIIGSQLRVVGSDKGAPRHLWIDFAAPKVDLRLV